MWKWFRWVLVAIAILILVGIGYIYWYYFVDIRFDKQMLSNSEKAFDVGITIDDPKDDFVIFESNKEDLNENNPSPYRLPVLDVRSLSLGADENYVYYKITFYDTFPSKPIDINGDRIVGIGNKLSVLDENSELSILYTGFGYLPILRMPVLNTYYFWGPTGIVWPEEDRFTHQDKDSKVYGGAGTNYVMGAFPINKSSLIYGQEAHLSFMMETESDRYTHAAVDVLRGKEKFGGIISWKVGTNQYKIEDQSDMQMNVN